MRTIESEFPDYDNARLNIPPFVCEPWHNEGCPRYVWRGDTPDLAECELTLWLDYKDPDLREDEGAPVYYFTVAIHNNSAPCLGFLGETEDELRDVLNDWYETHVGYRPDEDVASKLNETVLDLGELMHLVGTVAYLEFEEKQQ